VFVLVLVYVAIMAVRLSRIQRELAQLSSSQRAVPDDPRPSSPAPPPVS